MTGRTNDHSTAMRCRGCAYDLRGLAEHRCPECGRGFDPAKPETFLQRPVRVRSLFVLALISIPVMIGPLITIQLGWIRDAPRWTYPLWPISIITGFSMAWEAARRSINILRGRYAWVEQRWVALPAAIIGSALVALYLLSTVGAILYEWIIN